MQHTHQAHDCKGARLAGLIWLVVVPVKVLVKHVHPVVALDHPVRVQHRQQVEHELLAQHHRPGVLAVGQELDHPPHAVAAGSLPRVHPRRYYDTFLPGFELGRPIPDHPRDGLLLADDALARGNGQHTDGSALWRLGHLSVVIIYFLVHLPLPKAGQEPLIFGKGVRKRKGERHARVLDLKVEADSGLVLIGIDDGGGRQPPPGPLTAPDDWPVSVAVAGLVRQGRCGSACAACRW